MAGAETEPLAPAPSVDVHTVIAGRRFRFHFGRRRPVASSPHLTDLVIAVTWLVFVATEALPLFGWWLQTRWQPTTPGGLAAWHLLRNTALFDALLLDPPKVRRCISQEKGASLAARLWQQTRKLAFLRILKYTEKPQACGQWWRLFTVVLTHGGLAHIQGNMAVLKGLGYEAEARSGHLSFIVLYLLSALCGSLFSLHLTASRACGASGAIYGLLGWRLGHLFMDTVFYRKFAAAVQADPDKVGRTSLSVEQSLTALSHGKQLELEACWGHIKATVLNEALLALLVCVRPIAQEYPLLWLLLPNSHVDHWAHLGGFLGGCLMGACGKLCRPRRTSIYTELDARGQPALVATPSAYAVKVGHKTL